MSFKSITCDNAGRIYVVRDNGDLLFYQDEFRNGMNHPADGVYEGWANNGNQQLIGTGWDGFRRVFAGGNGILYAVTQNGELLYFRDMSGNGTWNWQYPEGKAIGYGWHEFLHVFSAGDGTIYAVHPSGELLYYKDLARDGSSNWAFYGSGQPIGSGWGNFLHVFGGEDGIIYAIQQDGTLLYYRDIVRNGTWKWDFCGTAGLLEPVGMLSQPSSTAEAESFMRSTPTQRALCATTRTRLETERCRGISKAAGQTIGTGWYMSQDKYEIEGGGWASTISPWISNAATDVWNEAVNFNTICRAARVSKTFLYDPKHSDLAEQIRSLRQHNPQSSTSTRTNSNKSDSAKDAQLARFKERVRTLEEQVRSLKEENELLYGKLSNRQA
jgi:hypothetical protein